MIPTQKARIDARRHSWIGALLVAPKRAGQSFLATALVLLALPAMSWAVVPSGYDVTVIGLPGARDSVAMDINTAGQVVGYSEFAIAEYPGVTYRAWIWSGGVTTELATLNGGTTIAVAINDAGQAAGWSDLGNYNTRAVLWSGGTVTNLGTLGGDWSRATAINAAGQVLGSSSTGSGEHAFRWTSGTMVDVGTLPGVNSSRPVAINASGIVVGNDFNQRSFVWNGGAPVDLGTLGGRTTNALGIGADGTVVGGSELAGGGLRAFVWSGTMAPLAGLGGTLSAALHRTPSGDIYGGAFDPSGRSHLVRWQAGSLTLADLGFAFFDTAAVNDVGQVVTSPNPSLFDGGQSVSLSSRVPSNFTVYQAHGINDAGQIVARVFNSRSHVYSAAVLTPYDAIFVDTTVDEVDAVPGDGQCRTASNHCSLRAAVQEANATPGNAKINIPPGNYALTIPGAGEDAAATGDLDITDALEVWGDRPTVPVLSAAGDRVFDVRTDDVALRLLKIRDSGNDAEPGGGIRILGLGGSVIAEGLVYEGNHAASGGAVALIGFEAGGTTIIDNSTFIGNHALGDGGAIYLDDDGQTNMWNLTVYENSANGSGGGLAIAASATLWNATITGNEADANGDGTGDAGGLYRISGVATMYNSILTGNRVSAASPLGSRLANCRGSFTSLGYNLLTRPENAACSGWLASSGAPMDWYLGAAENCGSPDPKFGTLGHYGYFLPVLPIQPTSCARDAASPIGAGSGGSSCIPYDARNGDRTAALFGRCDIGAFEFNPTEMAIATVAPGASATLTPGNPLVSVSVPSGAVSSPTVFSVNEQPNASRFGVGSVGTNLVVAADLGPENQPFLQPITVRLKWLDANNDGIVDGTSIAESQLRVWKNGNPITSICFLQSCATAAQSDCCDLVAGEWRVNVTSFSEYAMGTACGNAVVDPGEQCDGAALGSEDCCSPECTFATAGQTCASPGGGIGSAGRCDGAGSCAGVAACGPCEEPDPTGGCRARVRDDCTASLPLNGLLKTKPGTVAARDLLTWTWKNATAVTKADFGSPTTTATGYLLCVFDEAGGRATARVQALLPGGSSCGAKPCWTESTRGFRYADRAAAQDGIKSVTLTAGDAGRAKIVVNAKGAALDLEPPPYGTPVTAQLSRTDGAPCWSATYGTPKKNDPKIFQAKSD